MQQETQTQVTKISTSTPGNPPQKVYRTKKAIFRTYQIIWYILGVVEILLTFRVVLKMLGANSYSGFTNLIYTLSNPLAMPFNGIFRMSVREGAVFEWSTIIAGLVYVVIAYGIVQLLQLIKPTTPEEVEQTVDSQ